MYNKTVIIVTAGKQYTDIDTISSCYAYKKLMDLMNLPCKCVLPKTLIESVTKSIKGWNIPFQSEMNNCKTDLEFVMIDVSDPVRFPDFVNEEAIIEIYDHHWGFKEYWLSKLGEKSRIEHIGACATQIWERYIEEKLEDKVCTLVANLLYTTIFSHTLTLNLL